MAATGLGDAGHEAGEVADLLHALGGSKLKIVATEPRALDLAVGRPITDPLALRLHAENLITVDRTMRF